MTVEREVFQLMQVGRGPAEIMAALGISRYIYDSALNKLVSIGALGSLHQLPDGAETEICPPSILLRLFADVFASTDWADRITDAVRALCTRYGIVDPSTSDLRYTYANWTGQAFRRVDFTASDGIEYMVIGALMPRMDKKRWKEGTPYNRTVYIESEDRDTVVSFIWPRGRMISSSDVRAKSSYPVGLPNNQVPNLTLAIAWVCETRALFPERLTEE